MGSNVVRFSSRYPIQMTASAYQVLETKPDGTRVVRVDGKVMISCSIGSKPIGPHMANRREEMPVSGHKVQGKRNLGD